MGHSDYRHLTNIRMIVQNIFHFLGADIFSTANNDVFLSVSNQNGIIRRDMTNIPGQEETLAVMRLCILLRVSIPQHHARTARGNFSVLTIGHRYTVVVQYFYLVGIDRTIGFSRQFLLPIADKAQGDNGRFCTTVNSKRTTIV